VFPSWTELIQNGRGDERLIPLPGCLRSSDYFILGERLENIWLSVSGGSQTTCDGKTMGEFPRMLIPTLPLTTLSILNRILVKLGWMIGLLLLWVAPPRRSRFRVLSPRSAKRFIK
jgi:hypothetical protein